ncbi:MAG: DUF4214 domain-containing protein [Acidimicrobiales bacterium]
MKRTLAVAASAVAAGSIVLISPAGPAGAAVSASSAGVAISVSATGNETVRFDCAGGSATVNTVAVTPTIACTTVQSVTVTGDGGNQIVYLDDASFAFPNLANTTATTNGGNDLVFGSEAFDTVSLGANDDGFITTITGAEDAAVNLGAGTNDSVSINGTSGADKVTLLASTTELRAYATVGAGGSKTWIFNNAESAQVQGGAGDDVLDASGVDATSGLTYTSLSGEGGDDTLVAGAKQANMGGGTGTNTFTGGPEADYAFSGSDTDTIDMKGGENRIADLDSLRSGGRTITNSTGPNDYYDVDLGGGDAVWRVRPTGATSMQAVAALNRPGIQPLPAALFEAGAYFQGYNELADRNLADLVAGSKDLFVTGGDRKDVLVDITIPSGTWSTTGTIGNGSGTVSTDAPQTGDIFLNNVGPVSLHGKWANKDRGFVHRSTRDLMFRFASTATLDEGEAFLGDGTITRKQYTASLMGTDEYRGLDVDRTFIKYLRRKPDAGGRTYWINSIRNGKALWRFRAQLFGSNEYFTKAGGTNAAYVTRAYTDVLGRAPDPSGRTYWTNKLNNGADRGAVDLQFINSAEARRRLVDDQILRFLMRKPTTTEQTTWVAKLPGATGEQELIAFLVNSNEYYGLS